MYLSSKQIFSLIIPFLAGIILLYFEDDIITFMDARLPKIKNVNNDSLSHNVNEYLKLEKKKRNYDKTFENIAKNKKEIPWIVENVLFKKHTQKTASKAEVIHKEVIQRNGSWQVEAIFPGYDMAIINSKFVHKGTLIDTAKVMQIKFDRVLLKTNKGLKWIHLFY